MTSAQNKLKRATWRYYHHHKREFPWRSNTDPYHVLVSEIMLQQTQVTRVLEKFPEFLAAFPTMRDLARAGTRDVLRAWQGLGYNRRALYVQQAAAQIMHVHHGHVPRDEKILQTLQGVGPNTAAAIVAFAYNKPTVFIETNIRTVFLHHLFPNMREVPDKILMPFIAATCDRRRPREWYWALMDYGTHLKKTYNNPSRRSAQHHKQSAFEGSRRQLRGKIVREVVRAGSLSISSVARLVKQPASAVRSIVTELARDGLLAHAHGTVHIRGNN